MAGGLSLMLCEVQWFAWSNFRRQGLNARMTVVQIVVLLLSVGLITLGFIAFLFGLSSPYLIR
jgi:hypothetical protein